MDIKLIRPNSNFILIRRCALGDNIGNGKRGLDIGNGKYLEIPVDYSHITNFCEIIDVGRDVIFFKKEHCARHRADKIGCTIQVPELSTHLHCVDPEKFEYWMVRESADAHTTKKSKHKYIVSQRGCIVKPIIYE